MATIGFPLQPGRQSENQKAYVVRPQDGRLYVAKWPRSRGTPKQDYQRAHNQWMRDQVKAYKMGSSRTIEVARQASTLTRVRPQDRWLHISAGREWLLDGPDGGLIYPEQFRRLMSAALDTMAYSEGGLIVRGHRTWCPLPPPPITDTLTIIDGMPAWRESEVSIDEDDNNSTVTALSQDLDAIGQVPGSIMWRDTHTWTLLPPGKDGDVLRWSASKMAVEWHKP